MTRPSSRGFTLIELMITVAIVAILAAIAYPSYQRHVTDTWRTRAATCLGELAQGMERRYTEQFSYLLEGSEPQLPGAQCVSELASENRYAIGFADGQPNDQGFVIEAVPLGPQRRDTRCGTLSIDQAGATSTSGSAGSAACF